MHYGSSGHTRGKNHVDTPTNHKDPTTTPTNHQNHTTNLYGGGVGGGGDGDGGDEGSGVQNTTCNMELLSKKSVHD